MVKTIKESLWDDSVDLVLRQAKQAKDKEAAAKEKKIFGIETFSARVIGYHLAIGCLNSGRNTPKDSCVVFEQWAYCQIISPSLKHDVVSNSGRIVHRNAME